MSKESPVHVTIISIEYGSTRFAWSGSHISSCIGIYPLTIGLLHCCPDRVASVDSCAVAESVTCRCSSGLKPRDHISESIRALRWLPIKQRIDFKLCLLVHHTVNGRAPSYLQDLITPSVSIPRRSTLRSASHHDLVLQSSHRKFGDRSFSVTGPRASNALPKELKSITDTSLFKRKLETFLFQTAYDLA